MIGSKLLFARRLKLYTYSLLFIIWLLVGCTASLEENEMLTLPAPTTKEMGTSFTDSTPATASTVPLTTTPTTNPTQLPIPTDTSLPPTLPPTQLPTPTAVPTLTKDEEEMLIQELMTTNGGCQLPCWWGINLGDPLIDVGETYKSWGAAPWRVTTSGDEIGYIKLGYSEPGQSIDYVHVFAQYYANDGIVQYIKISANHESRQFGEAEFLRDWEKYFLPAMLQTYGKPALAYLRPGSIVEPSSNYTLLLYYPDLGINVAYNFLGTQLGNEVDEVCLTLNDVFLMQLFLYEPEFADNWPVDHLLGWGEDYEPWLIENQLGVDPDTFYETYQDPSNLGCIQIP